MDVDDILKFLEITTSLSDSIMTRTASREAADSAEIAATELTKLQGEISRQNTSLASKRQLAIAELNRQVREKDYLNKQFNAIGESVDIYGKIDNKDITESGEEYLKNASEDIKNRSFKNISDIAATDMSLKSLTNTIQQNNTFLNNANSHITTYNEAKNNFDKITDEAGVQGQIDMNDLNIWFDSPYNEEHKKLAAEGKEFTSWQEHMGYLERKHMHDNKKKFLADEAAISKPFVKNRYLFNRITGNAEIVSEADISQEDFNNPILIPVSLANIEFKQLSQAKKEESQESKKVYEELAAAHDILDTLGKNTEKFDWKVTTANFYGTDEKGFKQGADGYLHDVGRQKIKLHTLQSQGSVMNAMDMFASNILAIGKEYGDGGSDFGIPDNWEKKSLEWKFLKAKELITYNHEKAVNGQVMVTSDTVSPSDGKYFDITKTWTQAIPLHIASDSWAKWADAEGLQHDESGLAKGYLDYNIKVYNILDKWMQKQNWYSKKYNEMTKNYFGPTSETDKDVVFPD